MVEMGSDFWKSHLLFRDYLRPYPAIAQEDDKLERELARKYYENREAYANGKLNAASVVRLNSKQRQYAFVKTHIWNVKTGEKLFTLEGHKLDVEAIVFTRDNRFVMTGSVDGSMKVWSLKTGQLARTLSMRGREGLVIGKIL